MTTPVLASPKYDREFIVFSFASNETIATVLLQKNDEGYEQLISFFNRALRDVKVRYDILEKQAYALIKALKSFRIYLLHSKIIAYVPTSVFRDILGQSDSEGRRGKWIVKLLEYDLDIKPTKLIKGRGMAKLLAESNFQALGINQVNDETNVEQENSGLQISDESIESSWYKDIVYVLRNLQCPLDFDKTKGRGLKLKA